MRAVVAATIIITALLLPPCGPADALVGADVADRTVQRYIVLITSSKGRCSGVAVAQDIVLTAAHCVEGASKLMVGGSTAEQRRRAASPAVATPVLTAMPHPLYKASDNLSPDLSILKLAKPLPAPFIAAPINPRGLTEGENLIAAGFGQTSARDMSVGTVLRMVLMRVSQATRNWVTLVRTGEDETKGGHGDSGGPVFAYRGMHSVVGIIVGVTGSRTMAVALPAHYGWIRDTMEKMGAP